MKKIIFLLFSLLPASLAWAGGTDSSQSHYIQKRWYQTNGFKLAVPSAVFIGYGLSVTGNYGIGISSKSTQAFVVQTFPGFHLPIDNYLQFSPAVLALGLKLGGVKTQDNIEEGFIHYAFSILLSEGIVEGLKYSTHELRPDQSNYLSFPSGHTTAAFVSAEFLHQEFIDQSAWYSVAGYTLATATGALRMLNNRHWLSDVCVGAGIGILTTRLVYLAYPIVKNKLFHNTKKNLSYATYRY